MNARSAWENRIFPYFWTRSAFDRDCGAAFFWLWTSVKRAIALS
ncbi:hypothetical protein [Streptomyces sp. NPDC086777]